MNWTIGKKVTAAGGAILLLSVGTAGLGLKMNADLGDALDRATVSASSSRSAAGTMREHGGVDEARIATITMTILNRLIIVAAVEAGDGDGG